MPTHISRRAAISRLGAASLALGVPVSAMPSASRTADRPADEDIDKLLRLASVPSLTLASIDGDRITTKAFGVRRAGDAERVSADSVYAAASLTKMVFGYVFLGLANEGVVSLDAPVREYLPLPNPNDARAVSITARHLLSHSSGWRNWRDTNADVLTSNLEPGTRWSYSGEGYFFLQRILEMLTGKSLGQLARERVFEPLGMKRTSMAALAELEPFQVTGHGGRGEPRTPYGRAALLELRRMMTARNASLEAAMVSDSELALKTVDAAAAVLPNSLLVNAAFSMLTTANDFGIFLRHVVTAPRRGGPAAAIVKQMMTPQVRCNESIQWGLGAGLEDVGDRRYAWQWGDNPGFKAFYLADPQREQAIVVFTNGDRGARVYERVIRSLLGTDHPAFLWA